MDYRLLLEIINLCIDIMYNPNYCDTRRIKIRDSILKIIDNIPLDIKIKKWSLRIFHYILPIIQFLLITFGNINLFYLGASIFMTIIVFFILLNGCILTSIEKKIFDDNYTMADIGLDILYISKTNPNRVNITFFSFLIFLVYAIFVYLYRFK